MRKKISILSSYNRGQWLANELSSKGYDVTYLDFTKNLGALSPEVWDPPFGIFQTKDLSYSQNIWLNEGALLKPIKNGFTILSDKGPIEIQGPLHRLSLRRYGINQEIEDFLRLSYAWPTEVLNSVADKLSSLPFSESWLLHLSHQLSSNVFSKNSDSIIRGKRPLPIFENWSTRMMSRRGAQETLQMSQGKGVSVIEVRYLLELKKSKNEIENLVIQDIWGDRADVKAQIYINFLSQEEMNYINSDIRKEISGSTLVTCDWFWTRYRLFAEPNELLKILPQSFCYIEDKDIPWTHHNLMMIHRGHRSHEFIVWVRIPNSYRLRKNHLEKTGDEIKRALKQKLLGLDFSSMELPLECLATEFQIQAPHLPVYSKESLKSFELPSLKNFLWCGPEKWERLDTATLLTYQNHIMTEILGAGDNQGIKKRRGQNNEIYVS